jgi:DNA-binding transcriptional regulator YhcF (GntR family)
MTSIEGERALDAVRDLAESWVINPRSLLDPYIQIALVLRAEILTRQLPAGTPLQSEPELVARFGVSRETVRRAMGALRDLGLAETRRGVGTVVRRTPQVRRVKVAPGSTVIARMPTPEEVGEPIGFAVLVVTEPGKDPVAYDSGSTMLVFGE